MTVYSVVTGNNSDLITHMSELYLPQGARVRDVTWGRGAFWNGVDISGISLQGSDIGDHIVGTEPTPGHVVMYADFTALPDADESADIVVLDPPYIHNPGNHQTDSRYNNAATTKGMYHKDIRELYVEGMREAHRILVEGGQLWVKCKDQIESGRQCWAHIEMLEDAEKLGFYGRDLFVVVPTSRTSMKRWNSQLHARKIHSYLWVFDKPVPKKARMKPTAVIAEVDDLTSSPPLRTGIPDFSVL